MPEFKSGAFSMKWSAERRKTIVLERLQMALESNDFSCFMQIDYICYDRDRFPGLETVGDVVQTVKFEDIEAYKVWCRACGVEI